jgi:hypothetical protein
MVVLTGERWEHVVERHAEIEPHESSVLKAVTAPDRRVRGTRRREEWFYLAGVGPSRWLKVVVRYEDEEGRIITAFARRSFP